MTRAGAWLRGAATGAAALYFLDPDEGRRRRALVRDRTRHLARVARDEIERDWRDARNRLRGMTAKARRVGSGAAGTVVDEQQTRKIVAAATDGVRAGVERVGRMDPASRLAAGLVGLAALAPILRHLPVVGTARLAVLAALGSTVYGVERSRRSADAGRSAGTNLPAVEAPPPLR